METPAIERRFIERLVANFLAKDPCRDDKFRLAATMLHQCVNLLAPEDGYTTDAVEDALQAVLDMAEIFGIEIWD